MMFLAYLHKAGHTGGILRLGANHKLLWLRFLQEKKGQTNMLAMCKCAPSSLISPGFVI